jgi:hypothetical protein
MKYLKKTLVLIPFFIVSCVSPCLYLKDYEPINVFLETQKLDKNKKYILQSDKQDSRQALRLFNGGEGIKHIIDSTDPTDYTDGLFVEKHWKKIYKKYAQDTLKKYWRKEDFPKYDFILEQGTGLLLKSSFNDKYLDSGINEMIIISEPMYYWNRKYILFSYSKLYFDSSGSRVLVIMKKEEEKWVVVRTIGDYVYY